MAVSLRTDWVPMQAPPSKAATAAGAHGQPFHGDLLPHTFSDFPFLDDFLFDEALLGLLLDDPPPPPALLPGSLAGATARPAVAPPTSACPTAQSVAARLRRRRISEKTRELAQLIPGGPRMTTAEMLLAARNYVKFLQAQLGLLGLAGSSSPGSPAEELTRRLVASPAVQEKLAGVEKCLFPCGAVEAMRADPEIGSRPFILRGLGGLTSPAG